MIYILFLFPQTTSTKLFLKDSLF